MLSKVMNEHIHSTPGLVQVLEDASLQIFCFSARLSGVHCRSEASIGGSYLHSKILDFFSFLQESVRLRPFALPPELIIVTLRHLEFLSTSPLLLNHLPDEQLHYFESRIAYLRLGESVVQVVLIFAGCEVIELLEFVIIFFSRGNAITFGLKVMSRRSSSF